MIPTQQARHTEWSESNDSRAQDWSKIEGANLLLILLSLVVNDVVEAELVDTLGGGDDAEPVTELLLLEVLLGPVERMWSAGCRMPKLHRKENSQVLEVATGEGDVSNDLDLALASLGDDDVVTEVADTALDLDAVVEELLEGGDVEDLVARGLRSVDDELRSSVSVLYTIGIPSMQKLTFWVTFWALRPRAY
jgi:hypothetical protein